ncbi:MAG: Txe/YoeB family addiction module toxin [Verrucomicrobiales bacterium]|nr:Txe/YoeB family addiction module toxin [Verrucomicrobiales bacterium]
MRLIFAERAWRDYLFWQQTAPKITRRIHELIRDTMRHPFEGIGKPEPLRHALSGWGRGPRYEHRAVRFQPHPGRSERSLSCAITTDVHAEPLGRGEPPPRCSARGWEPVRIAFLRSTRLPGGGRSPVSFDMMGNRMLAGSHRRQRRQRRPAGAGDPKASLPSFGRFPDSGRRPPGSAGGRAPPGLWRVTSSVDRNVPRAGWPGRLRSCVRLGQATDERPSGVRPEGMHAADDAVGGVRCVFRGLRSRTPSVEPRGRFTSSFGISIKRLR